MDTDLDAMPSLRALVAFEAAARLESFSAAARELHISQPAVSRQVRSLEQALGVTLFVREHRRIRLTEAAEVYLGSIRDGLACVIEAGNTLQRSGKRDHVAIHANYGLAAYWLMPRLTTFHREFPDSDVAVKTNEVEQPLSSAEPEIAIRFGDGKWTDGEVRKLFSEVGFPVCAPQLLEEGPPLHSMHDLRNHRLLRLESGPSSWLDWPDFFRACDTDHAAPDKTTYNNYTLVIHAAIAGRGIAIGWDKIVDEYLDRGWLVRPLDVEVCTGRGYYTVSNRGVANSQTQDLVLSQLHE